ncbi:hypothetical protein ACFFSY_25480 [Paenibacillus aurantiacus]|uniref:Uncharacterized protein n=1 Tax=Paenibacillus aurantiacus TaxID=1936118 RepID=A0ABV5KZ03_9BACL
MGRREPNQIAVELNCEVTRVYRSISKYKRVKVPVVTARLDIYIDGDQLHDDNVFEADVFYESLVCDGTFPIFNCTCGIFGCGGYEVNVRHEEERVLWDTEGLIFEFERDAMLKFSKELLVRLETLERVLAENGLPPRYDHPTFASKIKRFEERR